MEEKITIPERIKGEFSSKEVDVRSLSPLNLAFVGDCIFDLMLRTLLVMEANRPAHELHVRKSGIAKAETQARMAEVLEDALSEEEAAVFRRGRNAKSGTAAKNASVTDYRKATGLEALMGYLYLAGREERMMELLKLGLERLKLRP